MIKQAIFILYILFSSTLFAYDVSPPCYKQLAYSFFREDLVIQGLSIYQVQQTSWTLIYRDLAKASANVPAIIQVRARSKNPNPLEPPFDPNGAIQVLQESLYQVFLNVMSRYRSNPYNLINTNTVNGLFSYLWEQQWNRIQQCVYYGR